jgi:hypothetical protein
MNPANRLTPELKSRIADGVLQEAGSRSVEQITNGENEQLVALLELRAERISPSRRSRSSSMFTPLGWNARRSRRCRQHPSAARL